MNYILDLDGTLIDSSERHYRLMEMLLKEYVPDILEKEIFLPAAFMQYKADGNSGKKYLLECMDIEEKKADCIMTAWQQQIEEEQWLGLDRLYPDAENFLERISQEGSDIYYLTARQKKAELFEELERLQIAEYPKEVKVVQPFHAFEEKKDFVKNLIASNDFTEKQLFVIGDTENEYRLAKELLLPYGILNRGFRSKRFWDQKEIVSYGSLEEICSLNAF
ncbi:MAG: HAD family hydrolase [Lachnospiraceae bacterium]